MVGGAEQGKLGCGICTEKKWSRRLARRGGTKQPRQTAGQRGGRPSIAGWQTVFFTLKTIICI
jgi:hypothetical protein